MSGEYDSNYPDQLRLLLESGDTPLLTGILVGLRTENRMPELQQIISIILEERQVRDMGLKTVRASATWGKENR